MYRQITPLYIIQVHITTFESYNYNRNCYHEPVIKNKHQHQRNSKPSPTIRPNINKTTTVSSFYRVVLLQKICVFDSNSIGSETPTDLAPIAAAPNVQGFSSLTREIRCLDGMSSRDFSPSAKPVTVNVRQCVEIQTLFNCLKRQNLMSLHRSIQHKRHEQKTNNTRET